ncbi:hypothetical protein FE374_00555 [Georgenia yuyongxinii]|uniref:Uncharacterized protein n=1 Tax=Georgenia yuyongxinii TaxID=2589797 RepID=A0A5B8C010_9MICO|nr:hypothetical protein [Georgenia yuyongxinii]QDC23320.1 hypothetical protein FE374_00555 [Georgenia yuyongxinii]
MRQASTAPARLLPVSRVLLALFVALTLLGFGSLFVLAGQTDRSFAWTIEPAATAAFLGAGYASGTVLMVLTLRQNTWGAARVPIVTVLIFTVLTLLATLIHLDRFHFGAAGALPRGAAWFWLVVYVVIPLGMVVALARQEHTARAERAAPVERPAPVDAPAPAEGRRRAGTSRSRPLPGWLRAALLAEGVVMFAVGVSLYVLPTTAQTLWPWTLTPLTARAVAAWLIAYGVATGLVVGENDLLRLRAPAVAYAVFGAGQLVVALRFAGEIAWGGPAAVGYLLVAAAVAATGIAAHLLGRRAVATTAPAEVRRAR